MKCRFMSTFLMISVHLLSKFHTYINKHVSALSLDSCVDFSSTGIQGQTMFSPLRLTFKPWLMKFYKSSRETSSYVQLLVLHNGQIQQQHSRFAFTLYMPCFPISTTGIMCNCYSEGFTNIISLCPGAE